LIRTRHHFLIWPSKQDAIITVRYQDSSTPLDIAAPVAPNSSPLEGTQSDLYEANAQDDE